MTDLTDLTLEAALDGLRNRDFSSEEITKAHIDACMEAADLNALITTTFEDALQTAKLCDAKLSNGEDGLLLGAPLGIKDLFCTEDVRTTAGSRILGDFKPQYESTVTANMKADGMVMLGKLNLDEFAMGSSNETSAFGSVVNPWKVNDELVPGGSSGGSAAAVAARICLGATATDTGGSIRQPASFTGTVGIKPTYGRCSRWGIVAFASSLDQAGPITRTVRDSAIMLQSMAGHDPKDSTSIDAPLSDFTAACERDIRGMRIGIPKEYILDGMPKEIEDHWQCGIEWMKDAGAEIVHVSLPHTRYALPAYYIVASAEASSNLARYDGMHYGIRVAGADLNDTYERTRGEGFGQEVCRRIIVGTYVLTAGYYDAYYLRAQKVRSRIAEDFKNVWPECDALLAPTCPSVAFPVGRPITDPVTMYLNDIFTVTANLAGLPAISVPTALDKDGLPLGLQVIGKALDEETVFATGRALEKAANFTAKPEKWWA